MVNMTYQEIIDETDGIEKKHRTLRTVFDKQSNEWNDTSIEQKAELLQKVLNTGKIGLRELVNQYRSYYQEELNNKSYVLTSIDESLKLVLSVMKTTLTVDDIEFTTQLMDSFDFKYQPNLTKKLDKIDYDFSQETINEIVLWKVNRYAELDVETIGLINTIDINSREMDESLTRDILSRLLRKDQKGVRLAMASTILRFRNPNIYQILDQRIYRIIFRRELKYSISRVDDQIEIYFDYLRKLKKVCEEHSIEFSYSDRELYCLDKVINKRIKLKGYS